LLIAGMIFVFTQVKMRSTIGTEAIDALRPWIVARFMREALADLEGKSYAELTQEEVETLGDNLQAASRVDIRSIQAKGHGENVVVRVEVWVDGKPPRDGKTIRYYAMNYSAVSGWTFSSEVGPLSYWVELW